VTRTVTPTGFCRALITGKASGSADGKVRRLVLRVRVAVPAWATPAARPIARQQIAASATAPWRQTSSLPHAARRPRCGGRLEVCPTRLAPQGVRSRWFAPSPANTDSAILVYYLGRVAGGTRPGDILSRRPLHPPSTHARPQVPKERPPVAPPSAHKPACRWSGRSTTLVPQSGAVSEVGQ